MKKRIENPLLNGVLSVIIALLVATIGWTVWSQFFMAIFKLIAGAPLQNAPAVLRDKFLLDAVEGTFFWMVICPWVWYTLNLGNFGKYKKTTKQPIAGIRYTLMAMATGAVLFFGFALLMGYSWEPFRLNILFTPQNNEEIALAIKGWGAINFFTLSVNLCQIPLAALFNKYPFAKHAPESAWANAFGTLFLGLLIALLNWNSVILPSFMQMSTTLVVEGQEIVRTITTQPFGSWTYTLSWAQLFIFFFLIPAEGGEMYPQKLITTKQPWSGLVGFAIAMIASLTLFPVLKELLLPLANHVGLDPNLAVGSLALTGINVMLTWHHHFYDYPGEDIQSSLVKRLLTRAAVVLIGGTVLGIFWILFMTKMPFGGNNMGLGHPMLGILGGQFVYMMPMLYMNTFFDKYPVTKSVEK